MSDFSWFEKAVDGLDKAAVSATGESFFDQVVEQLIAEPDPDRRDRLLNNLGPRTRANVEAVYTEKVRLALASLSPGGAA